MVAEPRENQTSQSLNDELFPRQYLPLQKNIYKKKRKAGCLLCLPARAAQSCSADLAGPLFKLLEADVLHGTAAARPGAAGSCVAAG